MLIGIVIIICLAVVMFFTLRPSEAEKQAKAEQEERLKDERIYHPETGRYFTLEELENEVIVIDNNYPRIKSDEDSSCFRPWPDNGQINTKRRA